MRPDPDRSPRRSRRTTAARAALAVLAGFLVSNPAPAQESERYEGPIIDMHLHAYTEASYWGAGPDGPVRHGGDSRPAPPSAEEHRRETLEAMDRHGVVLGVVSGEGLSAAEAWSEAAPDRFLTGVVVYDPVDDLDVETFAGWLREGRLDVFAEIGAQYGGHSPSDPAFTPYWSLAEEHGVPVGIHTGESFPGTPYSGSYPDFRVRLGDPLLLEEMLVAHPDLEVFVMHAGGWFWERTLQLMQMYPQVHAGIGVLGHAPDHVRTETLARFLRRAKDFGYLDRVMFGSDQMVWPGAIGVSIEAVQSLDFLSREEKRAIFYGNAARFLGLDEEEIARHHGG